jgi:hypothetical protein
MAVYAAVGASAWTRPFIMADVPDTVDSPLQGKSPAKVTPARTARKARTRTAPGKSPGRRAATKNGAAAKTSAAKTAAPKKAAPKKAAPKKAAPKKAAPKKAAPKKAAPKKAATKRSATKAGPAPRKDATKKTAAKKPPARKPPARKPAARKAPTRRVPTKQSSPAIEAAPSSTSGIRSVATTAPGSNDGSARAVESSGDPLRAPGRRRNERWALCASITEELLNDLVAMVLGAGVPLEPLNTSIALPGMGEVDVRLALTVNGGTFRLSSEDGGRARIVITALGDVQSRASAYDGTTVEGGPGLPVGMPTPPAPIPVRVEALVHPFVEVHRDHRVEVGLDLSDAQLVSLEADMTAPAPEGVDPGSWSGILQVFGMVFGMLGPTLFAALGEHIGTVGTEFGAEVGLALTELGVDPGRADINVASGLLSLGLAATPEVRGRAQPVPIAGHRVGIGMANSVVEHLTQKLLERAVGDLPLPFELEVDLGEQSVGGRLRQSRLLPGHFPDLRSSLRTEVRPRLLRGRLELSVQAAWLELPPLVPSFVNQFSKRLGELVSLAPVRVQFPARMDVPLVPDSADTVPLEIDDLQVTSNGLGVVVALA